ncbi:Protein mms22 [Beauveria bassiana D1-5]|uniref:Protein mms22 n=1 Tax=Beauveria bassiana D1-5 TaxID=1245745 RepID=A0A0A2VT46_BEABA|nr:Protein mms22 [Beauveria bassiana D1-5]
MADWKLLGEVPDSEDEDAFDSQEPATGLDSTTTHAGAIPEINHQDIWEFIGSQKAAEPVHNLPSSNGSLSSSPLSSAQSVDGLPELDTMFLEGKESASRLGNSGEGPNDLNILRTYIDPENHAPTTLADLSHFSSPNLAVNEDVALPSQDLGLLKNAHDLQRESVRLERSLRPRKPIQEHPYLLENAQYSSLIRQHGMRPLKMAMARARAARDEIPQDGEFQDDSQGNSLPDLSNSSQLLPGNDTDESGDFGLFNIPSSSPLRTSPWLSHRRSSNHGSSQGDTDNTSVADQDLPALHELLPNSQQNISSSTKRPNTTSGSSARKRKRHDIVDSDPMDVDSWGQDAPAASDKRLDAGPLPPIPRLQPSARRSVNVSPTKTVVTIVDSSSSEAEEHEEEEMRERQGSITDDSVNERLDYKRRIRGVLPASWLRLDQQASRDKAQKNLRIRQRNRTPEMEVRRGLAQTRTIINAVASTNSILFLDDSDDEKTVTQPATAEKTYHSQSRIFLIPDETPMRPNDDLADEGFIIEHDNIDTMFSGPTRRRRSNDASRNPNVGQRSNERTTTRHKQQKITASFNRSTSTPSGQLKSRQQQNLQQLGSKRQSAPRPTPKPLSILDVIEPDAPQFLRVAARTAKTRVNQGRSSPSKKIIRLAERVDYIDAIVSLNEWKLGSIPQRQDVSEASKNKRKQVSQKHFAERVAGQPTATRTNFKQLRVATQKAGKFVKQTSTGGSARYLPSGFPPNTLDAANFASTEDNDGVLPLLEPTNYARRSERIPADSLRPSRPAMLEAEDVGRVAPLIFHRQKKFLDSIYQKNNRESSVDASDVRSEVSTVRLSTAGLPKIGQHDFGRRKQSEKQPKHRVRLKKARKPVRIDVDAPQFSHAADPLPNSNPFEIEQTGPHTAHAEAKLAGLGPYGTVYTIHFESFPLDLGVYFHQSTLLGSGIIEDCRKSLNREILLSPRPRVFFQFGTYSCLWGNWNAQTSSELGIVLDLMVEELERPEGTTVSGESTVLEASKFIAKYATRALNFADQSAVKPFITRVLDVVRNFHTRLSGLIAGRSMSGRGPQITTMVYDNLLILVLVTLMICTEDNSLIAERLQVEDLLRSLVEVSVSNLLFMGIDRLQETYTRLRETGNREQGLRVDQPVIHSWALVMQILEIANIPRGSFWDVLRRLTVTNDRVSASEARTYESIWKILFTVLPLSEFNSSGILIPGKRYKAKSDGWMIVQQLLRPIFSIYQGNTRQVPSFNNYCRALINRCHYLVQQWGWRRSGSIIGVIFDFFGSQNLEHLRNEEANASPRFLEQLAGEPSLAVEPGDKCFHVFLKLLALSIQKLRAAGAIKDIRNLVARIIPNHNRQHLKEQTVHERDLAALRNHHDLLATLFWAAPPELRPSPALMERLVAPETSHKEASLINIRCWGQIARFIVAKGEASTAFKPFHLWRNNIFQKMVQQFDSAAADIQQQLLALPSEVRHTISENVISSMVLMNKEAVGDVLQASITASLDVMEHAAHLEAATFCLNTLQLQHIYKQFGVWPPELNWNTLQGAISTLDLFVDYIAEFKENEESQQSESHILDSVQGDDALLLLDHEISETYFSMVRCILLNGTSSHGRAVSGNFGGVEQGVAVAARLAACFINGGLVKLHELFKRGRFGLFDGPIHKLDFYQRQYFVLVVVTLLKADIDNFTDAGFTLCELWLLLLVRPNRYLKYQSQLAEILRERGEFFLPSADDGLTSSPSYECNDILFEFAISTMRRSIYEAAPNLRRNLTAVHSKALNLVMEQMKEDLKATSSQPVAHIAYVAFARRVISLIRTHGSEICVLDSFYYQISKDYSPSVEDPQLQIAAMVSYGLRLREGDPKVVQQLFFFLFNNFKMALISNNLDEEKKMLQKGMAQDRGITQFVLGKMLPAIIEATAIKSAAYPLLDLYVWAAGNRLKRSTTTYCLTDAELPGVRSVLQTILNGIDVWIAEQAPLTDVRLHTLESFFAGFNLLWPSIYEYSLNQDTSSAPWSEITELIRTLGQYVISSKDSLCQGRFWNSPQRFNEFFAAVAADSAPNRGIADVDVEGFVDNIKQDVNRNWFEADGRISILTPGKSRGGGALQGVLQARWDAATLMAGIKWQFMEWLKWKKRMDGGVDPMEREAFEMRLF